MCIGGEMEESRASRGWGEEGGGELRGMRSGGNSIEGKGKEGGVYFLNCHCLCFPA